VDPWLFAGPGSIEGAALLQLVESTQTYLQPFLELTDPVSTSRFVQDCQSKQLLPLLPSASASASAASSSRIITVLDEWRYNPKDFLYSKPKFSPRENVLCISVVEQDHLRIQICNVAQISKTIAIKSKSQDAIQMAMARVSAASAGGSINSNSNFKQHQEGIANDDDGSSQQSPGRPPSSIIHNANQSTNL
jgi:hypothetical protein